MIVNGWKRNREDRTKTDTTAKSHTHPGISLPKEDAVWKNTTYQSSHSLTHSLTLSLSVSKLCAGCIAVPLRRDGEEEDFTGLWWDWQFTGVAVFTLIKHKPVNCRSILAFKSNMSAMAEAVGCAPQRQERVALEVWKISPGKCGVLWWHNC